MAEHNFSKVDTRVRFPSPAHEPNSVVWRVAKSDLALLVFIYKTLDVLGHEILRIYPLQP